MYRLFFVVCIIIMTSCANGTPVSNPIPTATRPQNTELPAATATTVRATNTPISATPTIQPTTVRDVLAQFSEAQRRCLAIQIGKERIPVIMAGGDVSDVEKTMIEACQKDANARPAGTPLAQPSTDNPVFADETWITSSVDGVVWQKPIQLDSAASVPEILALPDGSLLAIWCSFKDKPARFQEKLATARLPKGATEWILEGPKIIPGAMESNITFVDPDLVLLPDGRIRLYAFNIQTDTVTHTIVSAISSDNGQTFTIEDGIRFETRQMWDPNVVILPDGTYRMYYNGQDAIRSASSSDGLTFTADPGDRWVKGAIPGALVEGDTIWLYGCEKGISRKSSSDGLTFSASEQLKIVAPTGGFFCDPSITKAQDKYWLILKMGKAKAPPQP